MYIRYRVRSGVECGAVVCPWHLVHGPDREHVVDGGVVAVVGDAGRAHAVEGDLGVVVVRFGSVGHAVSLSGTFGKRLRKMFYVKFTNLGSIPVKRQCFCTLLSGKIDRI